MPSKPTKRKRSGGNGPRVKKVTKVNKDFILKKLIPFILREHGEGFVMQHWLVGGRPGEGFRGDGIKHTFPSCGEAACIGGSTRILMGDEYAGATYVPEYLGLTDTQYDNLAYGWMDARKWPAKMVKDFRDAKTPLGKAKVAVRLLKKVVATDGKVLGKL